MGRAGAVTLPDARLTAFCHECLRRVTRRDNGDLDTHRDRGGRRCTHSGKSSPDWLRALAAGYASGATATLWPIERVAAHLGLTVNAARDALREGQVRPAGRAGPQRGPGGTRNLYDPLHVDELAHRRAADARRRAQITARVVACLQQLYAQARTVNGATPLDDPARAASLELNRRLAALHAAGASFPALDAAVGARPGTVRRRLVRHGVLGSRPPSVAPYLGVVVGGGRPRARVP